jgi:hypothetical protein
MGQPEPTGRLRKVGIVRRSTIATLPEAVARQCHVAPVRQPHVTGAIAEPTAGERAPPVTPETGGGRSPSTPLAPGSSLLAPRPMNCGGVSATNSDLAIDVRCEVRRSGPRLLERGLGPERVVASAASTPPTDRGIRFAPRQAPRRTEAAISSRVVCHRATQPQSAARTDSNDAPRWQPVKMPQAATYRRPTSNEP